MRCNLCGSQETAFKLKKRGINIVRCIRCGLIFSDYSLSREEADRIYQGAYFHAGQDGLNDYLDYMGREMASMRLNAARYLTEVRGIIKGGRLLDVGPAYGLFLNMARRYYDSYGVEISREASQFAKEKLNLNVETARFADAAYPSAFFDVLTMWGVLDQLEDPVKNMQKANLLLRSGGYIFIRIPDAGSIWARLNSARWTFWRPPVHNFYFSRRTIELLLEKTNFKVVYIRRVGKIINLEYLLYRLAPHRQDINGWGRGINFPVNMGDVMHVCAQKIN